MPDHASLAENGADIADETLAWRVEGMDCASCVAKVQTAVERLPGVSGIEVNLMAERLTVQQGKGEADPAVIERQVSALGYRPTRLANLGTQQHGHEHDGGAHTGHVHAHSEEEGAEERADTPWWRTGKARLAALLGGLVAVAWLLSQVFPREAYWIYVAATLIALVPFGRRAITLALAGTPFSIETLMCAAALGAVAIGAAEEAAIVVLLFAIGELLENEMVPDLRTGG